MGAKSSIQWTDASWTPVRVQVRSDAAEIARAKGYTSLVQIAEKMAGHVGPHCEHASPGCANCYSEANNGRCLPANGTGLPFDRRSRDLVDIIIDDDILIQPLHWRKPRKIFVCSQTDLFGEWVPDEVIDRVFAVMALCPQHTFQVLTKRALRMAEYLTSEDQDELIRRWGSEAGCLLDGPWIWADGKRFRRRIEHFISTSMGLSDDGEKFAEDEIPFPLPNVHVGVSAEDQPRFDERIEWLLRIPAVARFLSLEPLLGDIDLGLDRWFETGERRHDLHQIIVGGESGHGARSCRIAAVRSLVKQCADAGVSCFVKQLGALPVIEPEENLFDWPAHVIRDVWSGGDKVKLHDRSGGDMEEWAPDLRVRQLPEVPRA